MNIFSRKLSPRQYLEKQIDYYLELYDHLRGPHEHTEKQALEVVLRGLKEDAFRYIPEIELDKNPDPGQIKG